jgi:hypothetical protein
MISSTPSGIQIETFEVEDASVSEATTMATDAAAIELIEQLGLTGQKKLVNGNTVTRLPYRAMEAQEALVYQAICDSKAKVEDYSGEAIPLRVLQVIAHAKSTELFARLEIWFPKEYKIDDPVLVGVKQEVRNPTYPTWTTDVYYILARWGKCLLSLEQMEAIAMDLHRKARVAKLTSLAVQVKQALEETKESLDLKYLTQSVAVNGVTSA